MSGLWRLRRPEGFPHGDDRVKLWRNHAARRWRPPSSPCARIQRGVDQRFYREKYHAAATVDRFADRLREQIDLGALNTEL